MEASQAELARVIHRRVRRALLAALDALNAAVNLRTPPDRLAQIHSALSRAALRFLVVLLGAHRGLFEDANTLTGRLFAPSADPLEVIVSCEAGRPNAQFPAVLAPASAAFHDELELGLAQDGVDFASCPAEAIGNAYELLLGESVTRSPGGELCLASGKLRKQTGTFFTPRALTEIVVERALGRLPEASARPDFSVCDPAVGGGAFLIQIARSLSDRFRLGAAGRRALVERALFGVDSSPLAVAVAEAALCLFAADPSWSLAAAGRNLRVGDALLGAPRAKATRSAPRALASGCDFPREFPEVFARGGFDLVLGNPPWVAYAGRAAQPLPPARKAYFAEQYVTLKGYPTLHGLFVERALRLAPRGAIALVVPSPIADLDGYRAVRRVVRTTHTPCEPMLEFGQDAFESVTQPCFALIATAGGAAIEAGELDRPFRLEERQRAGAHAEELKPPAVLGELARLPSFPRELFGEMGFQTTSVVTRTLLLRAPTPDAEHDYPLLEGRDVHEFAERAPRLFLALDRAALSRARCRVREKNDYERVAFVVRQTARYPIAALHSGLPFRNSLLAGFTVEGLPAAFVVGLLNSALYRALHLASRRDARQATFPQVKISHLRALPRPPSAPVIESQIARITAELTHAPSTPSLRSQLDGLVFGLFSLSDSAIREVNEFLRARGVTSR